MTADQAGQLVEKVLPVLERQVQGPLRFLQNLEELSLKGNFLLMVLTPK